MCCFITLLLHLAFPGAVLYFRMEDMSKIMALE